MHIEFLALLGKIPAETNTTNRRFVDKEDRDSFMLSRSVPFPFQYEKINKTCQVKSQYDILSILEQLKTQMKENPSLTPLGLLAFPHASEVLSARECLLYYLGDSPHYAPSSLKVANPLRTGREPARHRETTLSVDENPSTLAQLYAMLDMYRGDEILTSKTSSIRDVHAQTLYKWESTVYQSESSLGVMEMERLLRNIFAYAQVPYITIYFVEDAKSCSFSFKKKTSASGKPKEDGVDGLPSHDWLTHSDEDLFDSLSQEQAKHSKVELDDLALTFPLSWGMCREIAIHEAGHYISFLLPLKHKMNRGPQPLSYSEYSILFAGHGAVYCSIYLFLLHQFNVFDKSSLYFNFRDSKIPFFVINSLKPEHIDEQISLFIEHHRRKSSYADAQLALLTSTKKVEKL